MTPRAAILLVFAAFGAVVGSHIGALPVILKTAAVSNEFFGISQSFAMLAVLSAMAAGGYASRYFDHRSVILFMIPAIGVTLGGALMVATPWSFFLSMGMLATLLSFLDLNMNAEGSIIEHELARPVFTSYHAALSLTLAAAAIFSSFVSVKFAVWAPGLFALVFLVAAIFLVLRALPQRPVHPVASMPVADAALPRLQLTMIGITIGFSNSCEIAAMLWAGQLLAALKPELLAYSGLGVAFFGVCSGGMRLFGDRLRGAFGDIAVLTGSLAVAVVGFTVLGFTPGFVTAVIAFAAVGVGLGCVFPSLYAMAGQLAPGRRAAAMGFASAVSGVPRFIAPWIMGLLAAWSSVNAVFAFSALLCIAAVLMVGLVLARFAPGTRPEAREV